MAITIYLAGPDVFLPDAASVGRRKQRVCRELGFEGLFPLDNDPAMATDASAIFRANCERMDRADVGLFNLTPFRGPSADAGTVFELGFMFARGKTIFGYSSAPLNYQTRVAAAHGPTNRRGAAIVDRDGLEIERFDLADNLMIARAIADSGGDIVISASAHSTAADALPAFEAFSQCLAVLASRGERR